MLANGPELFFLSISMFPLFSLRIYSTPIRSIDFIKISSKHVSREKENTTGDELSELFEAFVWSRRKGTDIRHGNEITEGNIWGKFIAEKKYFQQMWKNQKEFKMKRKFRALLK